MQDGIEEIKQLFFEESDEGLDAMESGLLGLGEGEADAEIINDIFRAAHSIKGGSSTFGFTQIAEFTHHAETLLDQMRDGSREVTSEAVDLLLKGVDCIREMMDSAREGEDVASDEVREVLKKVEAMHESEPGNEAAAAESASTADSASNPAASIESETQASPEDEAAYAWCIEFSPYLTFLQLGNKPELIFRELSELGDLKVAASTDNLPLLEQFDPSNCYIAWTLTISGEVEKDEIEEVFDWVDEDCNLELKALDENGNEFQQVQITKVHLDGSPVQETQNNSEVAEPKPAKNEASQDKPAVTAAAPAAKKPAKKAKAAKDGGSIRVGIDKIDALLNLVGELVITQSMLKKIGSEDNTPSEKLESGLSALESNARELQEVAMKMRMLSIKNTFTRFPRMVHDLSKQLEKQVELEIIGENTELDKTVLEKIGDPLVHLVRNALDHGIETPDLRVAAGKSEVGHMTLSASHEAGNIVIRISDDGAGINPEKVLNKARERGIVKSDEKLSVDEINNLIFRPGFSTAEVVSDVSGRGVGMDVVRRNIQDLGGRVEIESEFGKGSTFVIRLPLTMAILDGQLVEVGSHTYIVPLLSIMESVLIDTSKVSQVSNGAQVYRLRERNIPIVHTQGVLSHQMLDNEMLALENLSEEELSGRILVVVDLGNEVVGLVVDELLDQQQVVIKSLESNFKQVDGLSGATILGDGEVALILDLPGLVNQCFRKRGLKLTSAPIEEDEVA